MNMIVQSTAIGRESRRPREQKKNLSRQKSRFLKAPNDVRDGQTVDRNTLDGPKERSKLLRSAFHQLLAM